MPGKMQTEREGFSNPLTTSREPVGPAHAGDKGGLGDRALMDAVTIVLLSWAFVFFLGFSLRSFNI
jgi:hypothetical protein